MRRRDGHQVFVVVSGPYRNVGDSVIRRAALDWGRDIGVLQILMRRSSFDWEESLGLSDGDFKTGSAKAWMRRLVGTPKPVLLLEPGEFNLDRRFFKSSVFMLIASILVRLKGGTVLQAPRGLGRWSRFGGLLHRRTIADSPMILWRESHAAGRFPGMGALVPDIGFEFSGRTEHRSSRRYVVLSHRVDRPRLPEEALLAVRDFAQSAGLRLAVVSQVEEDDPRSSELGDWFGIDPSLWNGASSTEVEARLRSLYEETAVVISDRLHVLVLGAVHGASPIELAVEPNGKVLRHFAAVGLSDVSFDVNRLTTASIVAVLQNALDASVDVETAVARSQTTLADLRRDVSARLGVE